MSGAVDTIFDLWDSLADFAADAGVTYGAAKQMRRRHSIPVRYWPALIDGARKRGKKLTDKMLVVAHTRHVEHA